MYKWIIAILVLGSCKPGVRHQAVKETQGIVVNGKKINDADLLANEEINGTHYAVYIEHDRQSPEFKGLLDFNPDSSEKAEYRESYQELKKIAKLKFKTFELAGLPGEWMPLYLYKGRYYIYFPSEWGSADRRIITDSTVVYWPMDGPTPEAILSIAKKENNTWNITTRSYYLDQPRHTVIHIIDPQNKIAIWENSSGPWPERYGLYIPRKNAKNFDMIVSYCEEHKTGEFIFDKIDYTALLKSK